MGTFQEDLLNLRVKMATAIELGVVGEDHGIYQATLIQIMNEVEKIRQGREAELNNLRRQANVLEGELHAISKMNSIVMNVVHGFVTQAQRDAEAEAARKAEELELKQQPEHPVNVEITQNSTDMVAKEGTKKRKRD